MTDNISNIPTDWANPKWEEGDHAASWRDYVDRDVMKLWPSFTDKQQINLAHNFQHIADSWEWER